MLKLGVHGRPMGWIPLKKLIEKAQPLSSAKYVKFISFDDPEEAPGMKNRSYPWPYTEGLRMDEALHELTLMVTGVFGKPLPNQNGAPVRLMVPWKYGFKSIKSIQKIEFTDQQPKSLWNELAPQEYGFMRMGILRLIILAGPRPKSDQSGVGFSKDPYPTL